MKEVQAFRDALAGNVLRWKRQPRGPIAAEFCTLIEKASLTSNTFGIHCIAQKVSRR